MDPAATLRLEIPGATLEVELDPEAEFVPKLLAAWPEAGAMEGSAENIGGEVFFYEYTVDVPFDGTEREVFEVGDVVYWRAREGWGRFGILTFYGNTEFGDGDAPRAASPAIRIGRVRTNIAAVAGVQTGDPVRLSR